MPVYPLGTDIIIFYLRIITYEVDRECMRGMSTDQAILVFNMRQRLHFRFQSSPPPEGRVQLGNGWSVAVSYKFQSSPPPKGGCNLEVVGLTEWYDGFNPHPPRREGATWH